MENVYSAADILKRVIPGELFTLGLLSAFRPPGSLRADGSSYPYALADLRFDLATGTLEVKILEAGAEGGLVRALTEAFPSYSLAVQMEK